jgi:hypothetical protein
MAYPTYEPKWPRVAIGILTLGVVSAAAWLFGR